ncbi:MAG: noncanonical pyrimidine nucleotidase, YjjG family [Myxococcales bacterium]|nr:noncanonical pyrimidine nucleotidase, YjjG family [Myxococcales bacterium]
MPYATLLLDLDHTLFDSDASEALAFAQALATVGVDQPARYFPTYDAINRGLWAAVERGELPTAAIKLVRWERLVAATELDADPQVLAEAFLIGMGQHGELYPGAREVLAALADRADLALGLVTNGLAEVQRARIARLELDAYFDAVVVSSEVGVAKPAPAIFDVAFAQLADPPRASAVMVGDSLTSDLRGGRAAGIATCWFNPHGKPAADRALIDHEIAALTELLALV